MLAIRLGRIGKGIQPSYRIIIQEKTLSPKGKAFEIVGSYNPKTKNLVAARDRIEHWISHGAHPSSSLAILFKKNGFSNMEKFIKMEHHQRKKKEAEGTKESAPIKAEAKAEAPKKESVPAKAETPAESAASAEEKK